MRGVVISGIRYTLPEGSNSGLVAVTPIPEGQVTTISQELYNAELEDNLGTRNRNGLFNVPTDKTKVWLPYFAIKTVIADPQLAKVIKTAFGYFIAPTTVLPEAINLVKDGDIFRCAGEGIKPIEDYQYYIVKEGMPIAIPNFKTVEVLLYERGKSALSIKVLEESECIAASAIAMGSSIDSMSDKSAEWLPQFEDFTSFEKFQKLAQGSAEALALANQAAGAVQSQIDAANANSAATQAAALASSQQAAAALSQAQAAQQQAAAQIAQSNAAIAEANAAQAAAETLQADLALQLASLPVDQTQP